MPKTISTQFDREALPEWARRVPEVVQIAKRDLAFRCDVWRAAEDSQMQRVLIRYARWRIAAEENS